MSFFFRVAASPAKKTRLPRRLTKNRFVGIVLKKFRLTPDFFVRIALTVLLTAMLAKAVAEKVRSNGF
ncbi:TPA: hypothetical protein DCY68_00905 [Candidatus Azambacteria bacterium]|nr:hypothetical protein [Candidatus Azambacteria bacterium]